MKAWAPYGTIFGDPPPLPAPPPQRSYPSRPPSHRPGAGDLSGSLLSLIGGFALAVGPMLAWLTTESLSVDGLRKTDNEALVLVVIGGLAVVLALVRMIRIDAAGPAAMLLLGLVGVFFALSYLSSIQGHVQQIAHAGDGVVVGQVGPGIYLALGGGSAVSLGAIISLIAR